jgi:hypothetical protein
MMAMLNTHTTVLAASDLLNSLAAPVVILPAPAAGFMVHPVLATIEYSPVSVDYDLGDVTKLFIGPAGSPKTNNVLQSINATVLDGSSGPGAVVGVAPSVNAVKGKASAFSGVALVLTHDGSGELADGDGTAIVKVYYILAAC